jgi:hypothetical protein
VDERPPQVVPARLQLQAVSPDEGEANLLAARDRPLFGARVDPRTAARVGEPIRLAIDPSRFQFFAPETGESLLRRRDAAASS